MRVRLESNPTCTRTQPRIHLSDRVRMVCTHTVPRVTGADKTAAMEGAGKALRAAPRSALAHYWAGSVYAADLRMRDMLIHMQLAVRLQPYALFFQTWRAVSLFWAGQPDAAICHLRDILTVQPCDVLASHWLGHICAYTGRYDEACDAAARAHSIAGTTGPQGDWDGSRRRLDVLNPRRRSWNR